MEDANVTPTRDELIAEIAAQLHAPRREDGEFTTREYYEQMGLSHNQALRELLQGWHAGLLGRREVLENGKWTIVWRKKP